MIGSEIGKREEFNLVGKARSDDIPLSHASGQSSFVSPLPSAPRWTLISLSESARVARYRTAVTLKLKSHDSNRIIANEGFCSVSELLVVAPCGKEEWTIGVDLDLYCPCEVGNHVEERH